MAKRPSPIRVMRLIARLNIGGPSIHVALLTAGLSDSEFESRLVAGVLGEQEGDMSYIAHDLGVKPVLVPTLRREISPVNDVRALLDVSRLMRDFQPHVVHTHTAKAGFIGRLAAWLTGVPVVIHTFHGHVFHGYFGKLKTGLFLWLERLAARITTRILTISEGLREELITYRIGSPNQIQVIPLGLPLMKLTGERNGGVKPLKRELGLAVDQPLVGIVGRLVPIKNHEWFLEVAQRIIGNLPTCHFAIVGDGERRQELTALAASLGILEQVHFVGWRSDLADVYASLDVVVITSHNEGTPVSLLEAMAAGVPVVSSAVGGVPDVLKYGEIGTLVSIGDSAHLAEAIQGAVQSPNTEQIKLAQSWTLAHYDQARLIADIKSLYRKELQTKGVR